jgi:OOP family OmpA-OmpF porin
MTIRNLLLVVTTLAVVPVGAGCSAHAQITAQTAPPPPPPEAPPPPPPPPAPPRLRAHGRAQITGTRISLPGELEFDNGQATIKKTPANDELLSTLLETLKDSPAVTKLRIEGYTDNKGTSSANMTLSQNRANAVAAFLASHGIDSSRLVAQGFGMANPLVPNDTKDHMAMNRRTEFHIAEIDGKPANDNTLAPSSAH